MREVPVVRENDVWWDRSVLGGPSKGSLELLPSPLSELPASPSGVCNVWMGGMENDAADRWAGEAVSRVWPGAVVTVRACRRFVVRAVRRMTEFGTWQFLDVGLGLSVGPQVHEVARRMYRDARVVYVAQDPVVVERGQRALSRDPKAVMVRGDVRDPAALLADPVVTGHLDWTLPVGVVLGDALPFVGPSDDPAGIVAALRKVMIPGSGVVICHPVSCGGTAAARVWREAVGPVYPRSVEEIEGFFEGFKVWEPGVVRADLWRVPGSRGWTKRPGWADVLRYSPARQGGVCAVAGVGSLHGARVRSAPMPPSGDVGGRTPERMR
ncbi:MAG: hypothetical protein QG597_1689 [Actinomycetota bacterium]|nr:hypothetical protein [Actinomycetota bacterium]